MVLFIEELAFVLQPENDHYRRMVSWVILPTVMGTCHLTIPKPSGSLDPKVSACSHLPAPDCFLKQGHHLPWTLGWSTLSSSFDSGVAVVSSGAATSSHLSIYHLVLWEHIALVSVTLFPLSILWSQRLCSMAISPSEFPKSTLQWFPNAPLFPNHCSI